LLLRLLSALCISAWLVAACSSITPHENFIQHMQFHVGKNFTESQIRYMRPENFLGAKTLLDGQVEREYKFNYEKCRIFFKVDQTTNIVTSWRYEGNDDDCAISP
jgi:hypothetical protein